MCTGRFDSPQTNTQLKKTFRFLDAIAKHTLNVNTFTWKIGSNHGRRAQMPPLGFLKMSGLSLWGDNCLPFSLQNTLLYPQLSFQRKVGIMYCMAGQSSEEEMYNNESAGPALEEFLTLLGERVRLKGFTKYRAQLDIKSTCTSTLTLNINVIHKCQLNMNPTLGTATEIVILLCHLCINICCSRFLSSFCA